MLRQGDIRGEIGRSGLKEVDGVRQIGGELRVRELASLAARRSGKFLLVERNATPAPHRRRAPQHSPPIKFSRRMAAVVNLLGLEERKVVR